MNTPIYDFLKSYAQKDPLRLHMPGHKGKGEIGIENLDVTEISGADSLYEANGIIKESEDNASKLFSSTTFYSTEGSSHCIRTMVYLASIYSKRVCREPLILAARNVHKSFVSAATLVGINVEFLFSEKDTYLSSGIGAAEVLGYLKATEKKPVAVYLTSPDYLGNVADVCAIAEICKKEGMLLLVDNAHGAYLHFLEQSSHPIALGADIVCDSAHKTLPALTGGAYLHLSDFCSDALSPLVKEAMLLFGSTSPSYLTLLSLDLLNAKIDSTYRASLSRAASLVAILKDDISSMGYTTLGKEPMKITVKTKEYGYTGVELGRIFEEKSIIPEFYDNDYIVFMMPYSFTEKEYGKIKDVFLSIERKTPISTLPPTPTKPHRAMSIRDAVMASSEEILVKDSLNRIVSTLSVSCPPAVPIAVSGEVIDESAVRALLYYGIERVRVVK